LFVFEVLKETRFAKLSFAGVVGFDAGLDVGAFNGVVLPDIGGVGRMFAKVYEALGLAAFLLSPGLAVQSRPERSFIVWVLLPCSETCSITSPKGGLYERQAM
jgi:hypothetical protein